MEALKWQAWLVSNAKLPGPSYLTFERGVVRWTTTADDALHFADERDARRIAHETDDAGGIVQMSFQRTRR